MRQIDEYIKQIDEKIHQIDEKIHQIDEKIKYRCIYSVDKLGMDIFGGWIDQIEK